MGGKALTCRPGTTDWTTLLGVFEHGYHMPPVALKSPTCIVDLGLNVGFTASHFAQIYPAARVIGVEMDEKNFKCAVANTAPWKDRLTLFNAAIWSSDGELAYEANCREDSYHVSTAGAGASQTALKKVKSISMQTLLKTCGVNSVDFVKMDVEGAEKELLLTGSLDWLKCVKSIKIEIHEQDQYPLYVKALQSVGFNAAKDTVHWSAVIGWKD
jgi:FkbM family methyltransferase